MIVNIILTYYVGLRLVEMITCIRAFTYGVLKNLAFNTLKNYFISFNILLNNIFSSPILTQDPLK